MKLMLCGILLSSSGKWESEISRSYAMHNISPLYQILNKGNAEISTKELKGSHFPFLSCSPV